MRSADFSVAPRLAQATVMVVVETTHRGLGGWLRGLWRHRSMTKALRRADGYCGHRTYWRPRWTLGIIAWFEDAEDLQQFALASRHPQLVRWARTPGRIAEDAVKVYAAAPEGYTNGVWRAEGDVFGLIDHFTPVRDETRGPPVPRRPRSSADTAR